MGETWRNRIIDTRMVPAEQLHAHPDNWRTHPDSQASALRGLLSEVGIVAPLIAYESERYGGLTLIDGHLRRDAGGTWPVTVLDVSDEEADLILATFDPITGLAGADATLLDELLQGVNTGEAALQTLLTQMHAENELTTLQDADRSDADNKRNLGDAKAKIKPVLYADQLAVFEQAMRSTGLRNRGDALIAICQYYLDHAEERQLDALIESVSAA